MLLRECLYHHNLVCEHGIYNPVNIIRTAQLAESCVWFVGSGHPC